MSVSGLEFVPGDRVGDAAVRISDDFVETDDASGGGAFHELGDITIHVVVNMVVVPGGESHARWVKDTGVTGVGDGNGEGRAFGGCSGSVKSDGR